MPVRDMRFTAHPDGTITVDDFPDEVVVNEAFIAGGHVNACRLEGDRIYVSCENGSAVYVKLSDVPGGLGSSVWTRLYGGKKE